MMLSTCKIKQHRHSSHCWLSLVLNCCSRSDILILAQKLTSDKSLKAVCCDIINCLYTKVHTGETAVRPYT